MPTLDANSLLADPAPIWFDDFASDTLPGDDVQDTLPGGLHADPLQAALAQVEAARQRPALAVVPPPAADPLAMALPWLVRHLGVAAAVEAVVGPVHEDSPVPSDDVLPALRRIGFDAHLQRRSLASLKASDLPTVLLLNSGDACVLTARWQDGQGQAQCSVVLPGPQPEEFNTAEAEIDAEYSGVALLVNPPKPPFASALARARSGAVAAATPAAPTAESLVALAAAVQDAQRARQSAAAQTPNQPSTQPPVQPPVQPLPQPAAPTMAQRREPSLGAAPLAAPVRRADAPAAQPASAGLRREPQLGDLPAWPEQTLAGPDAQALAPEPSFLQARRSAGPTPGQALRRIGQDTGALLRSTAGLLAARLMPLARGLARLFAAARLHGGRRGRHGLQALRRCVQFTGQGLARALRQTGLRLRRRQQALVLVWRQARHRRQARLALADQALALPDLAPPAPNGPAAPAGADAWAESLAQAWQDAACDEQSALALQPAAVVHAAFARAAGPAAATPLPATATPRPAEPVAVGADPVAPVSPAAPALPTWACTPEADLAPAAPVRHAVLRPAAPTRARATAAAEAWGRRLAQAQSALVRLPAPAWQRVSQAARGWAQSADGQRLAWLPGLAACSALCLLVGAPQAWAGMVSGSSLQALQVAPRLLRSAFGSDLDQAARALGEQALDSLKAAQDELSCDARRPRADAPSVGAAAALAQAAPTALAVAVAEAVQAAAGPASAESAVPTASPRSPAPRGRGVPRRARHTCR